MSQQVQLPTQQKTSGVSKLVILSLVSLLVAFSLNFLSTVLSCVESRFPRDLGFILSHTIPGNTQWVLCGALLPVSLGLLSTSTKKAKLSKPFTIVAILFLSVQALCAILYVLDAAFDLFKIAKWDNISLYISAVSGYNMFSSCYSLFEALDGFQFDAEYLSVITRIVFSISSAALYILPNALCMIGFIKLGKEEHVANPTVLYDRLWKTMEQRGVTPQHLQSYYGISSKTVRRLQANEPVEQSTLNMLCAILHCPVSDIAEFLDN